MGLPSAEGSVQNLNKFEKNTGCLQVDMRKTLWKPISGEVTIDDFLLIHITFNINEFLSGK